MHDYIIGALIVIIVAIQFLVAFTTSKKITLFKSILPTVNNFETVKVFIPEDQIKSIKVEDILNNIGDYNGIAPFDIKVQEEMVKEKDTDILNIIEDTKNYKNDDELRLDDTVEEMIWMGYGNLEEKIKKSQIHQYIDMGWSILIDDKYRS